MVLMKYPILNATINLTQNCNLACSYCFTYGKAEKRLPLKTGQKIIDFLFDNAEKSGSKKIEISFWGGEPLLEWETLKDLVHYAENRKNGIEISFAGTTNGILLDEDRIKYLLEHQIFLMISLDGTEQTHDYYRKFKNGSGSHSLIMKNLEYVMKYWPIHKVRMSPYPENIDRFSIDVIYLVCHGVRKLMFSPVYEANWAEKAWQTWERECFKTVDFLSHMRTKGFLIDIEHFRSYQSRDRSYWPCGAGRFYVGFDIDGAIFPCHRFCKFGDERPWHEKSEVIGHVDYGITNWPFRSQFINFIPSCSHKKDCFEKTSCHGGCFAVNYDLTGDIHRAPPQLCRYVEMQERVSKYYSTKVSSQKIGESPPVWIRPS